MTVFVPAVKCAKVAIEGTWDGQSVVQTFWFTFGSEPLQADLDALCLDMANSFNASMRTSQATNYALTRITATRQVSADDIQGSYVPTTPIVGTGSGTSVPLNCAWVFSYRTAWRGRSFRGRGYQPSMLTSLQVGAGGGNITALAAIAANYVTHLITSPPTGWVWVVASHFVAKYPRSSALLTPIVSVIVNSWLDSQRRRLVGRGS